MKKILIISTSLRKGGNSDGLADTFMEGALQSGNHVEKLNLNEMNIKYCIGCLSCQKTKSCVISDDMKFILEKMKDSDVLVFATPVYFYGMSGQMKTLLDRTNPLYDTNYKFTDIYLIATAAENDVEAIEGTIHGLQGWIDCFPNTQLKDIVYGIDTTNIGDVLKKEELLETAFQMGKNIG